MSKITHPPEAQWDTYWRSIYNRIERRLAWILVSLGIIVLMSWGIWELLGAILGEASVPLFIKVALLAVGTGGAILLVSVVREKLFVNRHDPYKEIER
jgi:hypothetical protein